MNFGGDSFMGTNLSVGQALFMAEAEGQVDMVDTVDARVNLLLEMLSNFVSENPDVDPDSVIDELIEDCGLQISELEEYHCEKIDEILFGG